MYFKKILLHTKVRLTFEYYNQVDNTRVLKSSYSVSNISQARDWGPELQIMFQFYLGKILKNRLTN